LVIEKMPGLSLVSLVLKVGKVVDPEHRLTQQGERMPNLRGGLDGLVDLLSGSAGGTL
jgi:hypothetical protein